MKRKMPFLHPGALLREEVLNAHGLNVAQAADLLGVTRAAISRIVNEHAGISPEMSVRITTVFGGRPQFWLSMQADYDLQEATKKVKKLHLVPFRA